jgi:hypothetical protein
MAATVSKSSKINFYKFVQVKEPSSSDAKKPGAAQESKIAKSLNSNTKAINNLGATVNSLAKVLTDLKKVAIIDLEREQKKQSSFKSKFAKEQGEKKKALTSGILGAGKVKGFLESILGALEGLFKFFVGTEVLKWLSDPKNKKTIETAIDIIGKVGKFIFDVASWSITTTIDGLYDLLKDDATWQDRLLGFGKAIVGIGTILLGVRYLSNPTKIIGDITRGVGALIKFVTGRGRGGGGGGGSRRSRAGGAARFLLGTGIAVGAGYAINQSMNQPEQKAKGGKVKKKASGGGWINGPMSGYPVSLDGGKSTSFIGHGREYVARKAGGGAFVVPFNTPATQRMSGLTGQRIAEAQKGGYKLPGFASGGYLNEVKQRDGTSGSNANKKIFLHWSAGSRQGVTPYGNYGYQTYIGASGKPHSVSKYGSDWPWHTYNQNGPSNAGIGVAGMSTASEGARSWGSEAITNTQWEGMAKEAAALATNWGWKPGDITDKRVRTHYEEYRDHRDWYHKPEHYRWDLKQLFPSDAPGTGPDKIRKKIKRHMNVFTGKSTPEAGTHDDSSLPQGGWRWATGLADAVTGNRWDFDKRGSNAPSSPSSGGRDGSTGTDDTPAQQSHAAHGYGKLLDLIGSRESDSSGGYDAVNQIGTNGGHGVEGYSGPFSKMSQHSGKKLTSLTVGQVMELQSGWAGSMSNAEWIRKGKLHAVGRYQFIGPTLKSLVDAGVEGVKKSDPFNESTQNKLAIGLIKTSGLNTASRLKGTWIGLTHETDAAVMAALRGGGDTTSGGHGSTSSGAFRSAGPGGQLNGGPTAEAAKPMPLSDLLGTHSTRGSDYRSYTELGYKDYSTTSSASLAQATEQRNNARQQMVGSTNEAMRTVVAAVTQNNASVGQMVQTAVQQVQSMSQQGQATPPMIAGGDGGGSIIKTTASILNSFNNPLKGILK